MPRRQKKNRRSQALPNEPPWPNHRKERPFWARKYRPYPRRPLSWDPLFAALGFLFLCGCLFASPYIWGFVCGVYDRGWADAQHGHPSRDHEQGYRRRNR